MNAAVYVLGDRLAHGSTDRFERFGTLGLQRGSRPNRGVENGVEEIICAG